MCVTVLPETQSKWGNPRAAKIVYYTERSCRKSWNEMSWWNFTTIPIWTTRTAISRTRHARSIPSHRWRSLVGCNVKVYQQQTHSIGTSVGASPSIAPTSNPATNELSPTQPSWCRQTSALVYGSAGRKKFNLLHTGGLIVYLLVIKIDMYSCDVLNQYGVVLVVAWLQFQLEGFNLTELLKKKQMTDRWKDWVFHWSTREKKSNSVESGFFNIHIKRFLST